MTAKMSNSWKTFSLGEITTFFSGGTPNRQTPEYWNGDVPWLSAKDLKQFRLTDSIEKITEHGSKNGTRIVGAGAVLILVRGMTLMKDVPVGVTCRAVAFNQDLRALIPNEKVDSRYLAYYLVANKSRLLSLVDQAGHGTGRLATELLSDFDIEVPPLREQKRISEILSIWDTAIENIEKLIAAKVELKKALMQQLLTGKRRFQEFAGQEWKQVHLGEVFRERCETLAEYLRKLSNNGKEEITLELLSITAKSGVVQRDTLDKRDTSNEDKSKYLRICRGDIGYNTMRMWQGVSGLSEHEGIVSPAYTICTPTDAIDGKFASYLFKHTPMIHLFWRYSQGLVDDTLNLKFHHFAQIKFLLPPIDEQRRIAGVLEACDKEIKLLVKQRDALKEQKRGLMQQLLTGKIRVQTEVEV